MRQTIILSLVSYALCVSSLLAQAAEDPVITAIKAEGMEGKSQVMAHLDHLTNRIGPRLTSSDRLTQAMEWAVKRFQSYGIDARIEEWGTMPVGFNRGPWFGGMVKPVQRKFTFTTPAWSPGTTGKKSGEAILAGTTVEEVGELSGKVSGKWVVMYPSSYPRGTTGPRIKRAAKKALEELCEQEGALGTVTSSGRDIVRTSGNWRISWDNLPKLVKVTTVHADFLALVESLERTEPVVLEFDIRNWFRKGPIKLYNVIAEIKGSEKPDEFVVVGGHLDSWDGATGTTDNGTGTSTTIEAARLLAKAGAKPKRSIRFMLWAGEEQGLLGSAAWCKAHQDELAKCSACFVHDGGTNYVSGVGVTKSQLEDFEKVCAPLVGWSTSMPFEIKEVKGLRGGGSDHGSFIRYGVPGYFWGQAGRVVYGYGWHTQNDTYDLAVPEYQRHTSVCAAVVAYGVANLPSLLSRDEMRSAAERPRRGRTLGVQLDQGSMKVDAVTPQSAAANAGVKPGDILMELGGVKLADRFRLREAANTGDAKKKLMVKRGGEMIALEISWSK